MLKSSNDQAIQEARKLILKSVEEFNQLETTEICVSQVIIYLSYYYCSLTLAYQLNYNILFSEGHWLFNCKWKSEVKCYHGSLQSSDAYLSRWRQTQEFACPRPSSSDWDCQKLIEGNFHWRRNQDQEETNHCSTGDYIFISHKTDYHKRKSTGNYLYFQCCNWWILNWVLIGHFGGRPSGIRATCSR